jgi:hypothetical protein
MTPEQALQILDNIAAQVALNRKDRDTANQATAVLLNAIKKPLAAVPEKAAKK